MQSVDLAAASGRLIEQATDEHEGVEGPLRDVVQLAANAAQNTPGVSLQLLQSLAQALELPGMGVTPDLQGQAVVVLPQRDPAFIGKGDKLAASLLIQARIGRMGDVLFHHRRIHCDTRQAAIL